MKKIALLLALLLSGPVFAADNAVILTPGTGVTMKSKDIGAGVQAMQPVISDTGGNALSTPTAGADGVSNTSTGLLSYGRNFVFNGTTWDRWLGDTTNGAFVNVKASVLPSGASTSALQTTANTTLSTIATNTAAAIPAGTSIIGKVGIDQTTPGTTNAVSLNGGLATASQDPCTGGLKTNLPISQNGTSSVQLIALSGSTKIYVCSLSIVAAGATTVAFTTGTGSACVTGNAAVIGTTTASIANSISLAANGGMTLGSGSGTIASGAASSELCMILGTSVFVSGNLTYVQQ